MIFKIKKVYYKRLILIIFQSLVVFAIFLTYRTQKCKVVDEVVLNPNVYPCDPIILDSKQFKVIIEGVEYPKIIPLYHNKSINFECLNSGTKRKTILLWNKFTGKPILNYEFGKKEIFEKYKCPVTNCELTNDKSKLNISDLVLFHLRSVLNQFPTHRPSNQRWVHVIYEAPVHCGLCDKYENTFNLSATFTKDSDFTSLYWTDTGFYWDKASNQSIEPILKNKTQSVFPALISHCGARSKREVFLNVIGKYISVKLYGGCGEPCPENDCQKFIFTKYKFFFALENCFCRDYVTEKFFNVLKYDIIPVVFGDGNYDQYIPKSGYVNVFDYKRPKDLADYLLYLDGNQTAYNEYFKWKIYLKYDENHPIGGYLCEMCIKMHLEEYYGRIERKQFNSLHKYFGLDENCRDFKIDQLTEKYEFTPSQDGSNHLYVKDFLF